MLTTSSYLGERQLLLPQHSACKVLGESPCCGGAFPGGVSQALMIKAQFRSVITRGCVHLGEFGGLRCLAPALHLQQGRADTRHSAVAGAFHVVLLLSAAHGARPWRQLLGHEPGLVPGCQWSGHGRELEQLWVQWGVSRTGSCVAESRHRPMLCARWAWQDLCRDGGSLHAGSAVLARPCPSTPRSPGHCSHPCAPGLGAGKVDSLHLILHLQVARPAQALGYI